LRFTVRRPSIGEVSPCGHRPSGGDVACSVDVGVAPPGRAGFALEDRSALAVSECDAPARGASLRRVRSRDLLDPAESLVLQARDGNTAVDAHHAAIAWTGDQLRRLLQIPGRLAARLPVLLLLHRQIPHIPRVSAVRQQCLLLLNGRQQSKPRHIRTLATDTDISRPRATVPVVIGFLELKSRASSPKETSMRRKRAAFCCTDVISAVERSSCRARREGQSK
jgi:hypothetical protein